MPPSVAALLAFARYRHHSPLTHQPHTLSTCAAALLHHDRLHTAGADDANAELRPYNKHRATASHHSDTSHTAGPSPATLQRNALTTATDSSRHSHSPLSPRPALLPPPRAHSCLQTQTSSPLHSADRHSAWSMAAIP